MSEHGYGGFWIRFLALLVDSVIIITALFALVLFATQLGPIATAVISVVYFVGPYFYWVVMHASERQATFGKALLGMTVTDSDGRRLTLLRSFGRELAKILSTIPLALGYVIAAFTQRKQALHDIVASTTVVRHDPGRVFLGVLIGVFGWLAPVAIILVAGAGMFVSQLQRMNSSIMQGALSGITADSTPSRDTAVVQAASNTAPAGTGVDAIFAARLTGLEEKPGMTRAGPVLLELSTIFDKTFWIKAHLPQLKEFEGADPVLSLSQVTDSKGSQLYDPSNKLETPFFQKVTLSSSNSPVPHLTGTRAVSLKDGASARDLQRVEGKVTLSISVGGSNVEREFPFVLTKDGTAGALASDTRVAASSPAPASAANVTAPAARTKAPAPERTTPASQPQPAAVVATARAEVARPPRPRPETTVTPLDPEAVAALDQLSSRFATEVPLVSARFRDRTVQLYDFGTVPRGAAAARVFWPIHGFDARGNPVAIRGQRPIFTTLPRLGASGLWQLVYVVTADMAQPNALRDAAAIDAAVRARRATLRDVNLVLNLPIVPRGTTLARDTTSGMLGWYKGQDVQFFDFGPATLDPASTLGFAAARDSAGQPIVMVADSAADVRNLQIAVVDGAATPRVPSPLRAFADMRSPSPPKATRSP